VPNNGMAPILTWNITSKKGDLRRKMFESRPMKKFTLDIIINF